MDSNPDLAADDGAGPAHAEGRAGSPHRAPVPRRLVHVAGATLSTDTAQTGGMARFVAISGHTVGSQGVWMGLTHLAPGSTSGIHHHGESETAIYVVSGHPVFTFVDAAPGGGLQVRLETAPGDFVFVPPHTPHREENPSSDCAAVVVIARSTQEAIVVNLDDVAPG